MAREARLHSRADIVILAPDLEAGGWKLDEARIYEKLLVFFIPSIMRMQPLGLRRYIHAHFLPLSVKRLRTQKFTNSLTEIRD